MGGLGRYQCVRPLIHPIPPPFHASYVLFSKLSPALWPFFPFFFFFVLSLFHFLAYLLCLLGFVCFSGVFRVPCMCWLVHQSVVSEVKL